MFEVAGTHFSKGVFQIDLDRRPGGLLGSLMALGAIRGRLIALSFILLAGFLTIRRQPAAYLMLTAGWDPSTSVLVQKILTWTLLIVGAGIYLLVILRRPETLTLAFDRSREEFRFLHTPGGRHARAQEGVFPFRAIESLELFSKERQPATPHGFAELRIKPDQIPEPYRSFRFRFLTDEQFSFFPSNISKMTGIEPRGDFKDPDDEPVRT